MATRGWEKVSSEDIGRLQRSQANTATAALPTSKYKNVRFSVDGLGFDSKREAAYYVGLKARAHNGEITNLQIHPTFALLAPTPGGINVEVAQYEADFTYRDASGGRHTVDVKGVRTKMFLLKRKWLELQEGIVIEEV